jgi:hypothetical protein
MRYGKAWWWAGLIGVAGGCASMQGDRTPANPTTQQVRESQQQSQQALKQAQEAQQRATDQAKRAADAQGEVRDLQQQLVQAQQKAKDEQAKAQQLQQEANQATQRSAQDAQASQRQAAETLSQATRQVQRDEQTVSGMVTQASPGELVVRPRSGGDPMTFRLTEQTQVRIDGRQASATEIRQGADALVSYQVSGTQPTASSVQVLTGSGPAGTGSGSSSGSSGTPSATPTGPSGSSSPSEPPRSRY